MQEIVINKLSKHDFRTSEAYKSLRTNVQFAGEEVKIIAITSCTPNEGKTNVSFNLAISMAEANKKVLFIDADMRKSVVVGRYKLSKAGKGLTHYLSGQCTFDEALCLTQIPKLHMVVAGPVPPNPAELLEGKRFREMLKSVREVYDYVIIDTPPLGSVIDAAIIAKQSDGAIMVVSADEISYKFAQKVKNQLEISGSRILGAILNKVDVRAAGYYGRYYGKYYGKYFGKYYGSYYGKEEDKL